MPIPRNDLFIASGAATSAPRGEQRERDTRVALLASLELFAPLTDEERLALAAEFKPAPFVAGDIITRAGEPPIRCTFLLAARSASFATRTQPAERRGSVSPPCRRPAYFGEMGLLTGQARTATVVAEAEVALLQARQTGLRGDPQGAARAGRSAVADLGRATGRQRCDARFACRPRRGPARPGRAPATLCAQSRSSSVFNGQYRRLVPPVNAAAVGAARRVPARTAVRLASGNDKVVALQHEYAVVAAFRRQPRERQARKCRFGRRPIVPDFDHQQALRRQELRRFAR